MTLLFALRGQMKRPDREFVKQAGPCANEGRAMGMMSEFVEQQGMAFHGRHHEICLSDPRGIAPEKLKTILRMPIARRKA